MSGALAVLDDVIAVHSDPTSNKEARIKRDLIKVRAAVVALMQSSALLDAELEAAWKAGKIPFDATSVSTVRAFKDALANMQGGGA